MSARRGRRALATASADGVRARRRAALLRAGYRYAGMMSAHSDTGRIWARADGAEVWWMDGPEPIAYEVDRAGVRSSIAGVEDLVAYLDAEAARR
jgi:hypothetical protein